MQDDTESKPLHARSGEKGRPAPHDSPKGRIRTSDVAALLAIAGRAQSEFLGRRTDSQVVTAGLTLGQLHEWFNRDRYVYAETIAEGGMARIYCAADLFLCRTVALKTLQADLSEEALARFLYEAQIAAQLEHPNVVPIYDVGLDPQTEKPYLIMKLIAGRSMLDIILDLRHKEKRARRFRSLPDRLAIFLKVCDAIAYAHAHKVIHRDIKPANVMVGDYGEVYVIDWGIAESRSDLPGADPTTGRVRFERTRVSTFHDVYRFTDPAADKSFMGSPVHMAPEQIVDPDRIDERSDIYGLGCTLYELITLNAPFSATLPIDQLLQAKRERNYIPAGRRTALARNGLDAIIDRCLAPRKRDRYQSVTALQNAIRRHLQTGFGNALPRRVAALEEWVRTLDPAGFTEETKQELLRRIQRIRRAGSRKKSPPPT